MVANARFPQGSANAVNVFSMAAAFAEAGHRVRLIALRSAKAGRAAAWAQTQRRFGRQIDIRPSLIFWPLNRGAEPLLALMSVLLLPFLSRRTVVYTRVRYAAVAAAACGFATIFESHAPPSAGLQRGLDSWLLSRRRVRLIVISEALRRLYEGAGLPVSDILVAPDAGWALPGSAPIEADFLGPVRDIGYVGTLHAGRGVEVILAMAARLPACRFHVVGPPDTYAGPREPIPDNVSFHDAVTPAQALTLYRLFDVLLMPYQARVELSNRLDTSAWMSPMKMFEYMLGGRPVISSDLPVLREVLRDGENALMVSPENAEAWVEAVLRLNDPALRFRLAQTAWAEARTCYTWRARLERICDRTGVFEP